MSLEAVVHEELFLLGRLVFAGMLGYMAAQHFLKIGFYTEYAGAKDLPAPRIAVLTSGGVLLAGSALILTGVSPSVGAILLLAFMIPVTLRMHDFWNVEDPEDRLNEFFHFEKNVIIIGAVLIILAISMESWPLALL